MSVSPRRAIVLGLLLFASPTSLQAQVGSTFTDLGSYGPAGVEGGYADDCGPAGAQGVYPGDCGPLCCESNCGKKRRCCLSIPRTTDDCFVDFISPITNPVFFEDPRNVTELRTIFLRHQVPREAGGDNVHLIAVQVRMALAENISLIATKDGFITSQNPLIDDGWADVAAGLKFNLLKDYAAQRLLSAGLTYEIAAGSKRTLQGNGDGEFNLFFTGGTQVGAKGHWISATGFRLPSNRTDESQVWYWSNHLDHQFAKGLYGLLEFNWYHWMRSGQDGPIPGVEGGDLFNLGSPGVAGNDIVTGAFGFKLKPNPHTEIGVAWEVPLTERRDVLDNRLAVDWIIRY